ncbi:MAG: hypothetical protein QM658_14110 [Gordonia sp. (in: high G+C Gram-positive bacteria)]
MNAPQLFKTDEFELPIIPTDDGFRVHGMTVARQLGFRDAYQMVRPLDADEKVLVKSDANAQVEPHTNLCVGTDQELYGAAADHGVWYLTEPGFYRVVGQRNIRVITDKKARDAVHRFQRWVFHDIIPEMMRTGRADQMGIAAGTTWDWDEVAAEIRQRYGLDWKPSQITRGLRAAGWLKNGGTTPKWAHHDKFWHTGTAWHLLPYALADLVVALVPTMRELGDPQAQQYQLDLFPPTKELTE